jgi:hypothetical protein
MEIFSMLLKQEIQKQKCWIHGLCSPRIILQDVTKRLSALIFTVFTLSPFHALEASKIFKNGYQMKEICIYC